MALIEEDIISFYGKQHTIDLDKTQEEKPLKSRLRQRRSVNYNYDDDSNDSNENYDTDEYNTDNENDVMFEWNNNKHKDSFVSEYSNYTPGGIRKSNLKSKSERKQNKSRLNDGIDIDIDMNNNNSNNKSKDKNKTKSKKKERNVPSMRDIVQQTGLRSRKKDNNKNEAKIPQNCSMKALNPEVLKDMHNLSREEFFKKHGFSYSKRILQQMDKIDRIEKKNDNDEKQMSASQDQVENVISQVVEHAKSGGDGGCNIQVSKQQNGGNENENLMYHCNQNNNNNNSNNISMHVDEEQKKERKENDMNDIGMNLNDNTSDNVEKENVDDIINDNNSNDHDSDTIDKHLSDLVEKYQKCLESLSLDDLLSVIDETDTFIKESSHNETDSGIFDIFYSISPLLRAVKRLIGKSKQESNSNNGKSEQNISIQASMIKNQLEFLQNAYETDLKSMKINKQNDKKNSVLRYDDVRDFASHGMIGIHGMSSYDNSSWSINNVNDNYNQEKFGPSRGISYNSIDVRLEAQPYNMLQPFAKNKGKDKENQTVSGLQMSESAKQKSNNFNNSNSNNNYSGNSDDNNKNGNKNESDVDVVNQKKWTCKVCTLENDYQSEKCVACTEWKNTTISNMNHKQNKMDKIDNDDELLMTDNTDKSHNTNDLNIEPNAHVNDKSNNTKWKCKQCTFLNNCSLIECAICGLDKAAKDKNNNRNNNEDSNSEKNKLPNYLNDNTGEDSEYGDDDLKSDETNEKQYSQHTPKIKSKSKSRNKNIYKNSINSRSNHNKRGKRGKKDSLFNIIMNDDDEIITIDGDDFAVAEIIQNYSVVSKLLTHEKVTHGLPLKEDEETVKRQIHTWNETDMLYFYCKISELVEEMANEKKCFRNGKVSGAQWDRFIE